MQLKKIVLLILFSIDIVFGDSNLTIYSDYNKSIEMAQKENKPIFILFTTKHCRWCKKLKSNVLTKKKIEEQLKSDFIVLFLDRDHDDYPKKYKIEAVPDVLLISEVEEIYAEILGYHSKEKEYLKWFNYVKIERD